MDDNPGSKKKQKGLARDGKEKGEESKVELSKEQNLRARPEDILALIAEFQGQAPGENPVEILDGCEQEVKDEMYVCISSFVTCLHSYDRIRQETTEALRQVQESLTTRMDQTEKRLTENFVIKAGQILEAQRRNKANKEKLQRWEKMYACYQETAENIGNFFD
eukprot:jgi/Pico_ML_1/56114/g1704.t1